MGAGSAPRAECVEEQIYKRTSREVVKRRRRTAEMRAGV
jgi:hypothetical protein